MKQFPSNALRLAILAALAGGSAAANAASVPVANEFPTTLAITLVPLTANATTTFTPGSAQALQVTVSLSGNTKFTSAPAVYCASASAFASARFATAGAGAPAIKPALSLGGAGSTMVVFSSTTARPVKVCKVSARALTVTGAHASVTESITFKYGSLASSNASNTLITWPSGLSAATPTVKTVTAKVTGGFSKLAGAATLTTGGTVAWYAVTAGAANSATIGTKANLGTYMGATSGSITFTGNPLTAAKSSGTYLVAAASNCAVGGKISSATIAGSSVTFTKLTPTQVSAGARLCVRFNGTTAIPEGSITAQLGGNAKTGYSLPTPAASTVLTVTRDGSSISLMNMPRSTDTDAGYLRVYNTSSIAGAVTATVYDQSGTALATNCTLSSSLAANAALVMTAAQVETACGFAVPATGRYRLEIAGAVPSMKGQMFVRSASVLTNVTADK